MNRLQDRIQQQEELSEGRQTAMAILAKAISEVAKNLGMQYSSGGHLEGDGHQEKIPVIFSAWPNGDVMLWILEGGFYTVIGLVNQKTRHISRIPATTPEVFQEELNKLQEILGK